MIFPEHHYTIDTTQLTLSPLEALEHTKLTTKMSNPPGHAPFLAGLLGQAKEGGKNLARPRTQLKNPQVKPLTAEQLANVISFLDQSKRTRRDQDRYTQEQLHRATVPIDINGKANHSDNPVFFLPRSSKSARVTGVPYAVSDINHLCNQCTRTRHCPRHRTPAPPEKTSVSLCTQNHTRLALWWNITDIENRQKTWRLSIEKHSKIICPQPHTENETKFCHPHPGHMRARIELLAKRITEDYNDHQKDLARRAVLDPKGREYYTRRKDWGGRDPFESDGRASTRKAHEFKVLGASRVEMEITVLLQTWYRGQLKGKERGFDVSRARAMRIWGERRNRVVKSEQARKAVVEDSGEAEPEDARVVRTAKATTMEATRKRKSVYASDEDEKQFVRKQAKKIRTHISVLEDSNDAEEAEINDKKIFEQLVDDVAETEIKADKKSREMTSVPEERRIVEKISVPRKTAALHKPTAEELKLLQRIKQAEDDESQSEEEYKKPKRD
jgi:hypothetical protein